MQLEPRNRNRCTPDATALSRRLTWIRRLSEKKSAGRLALAAMPPTRAAASITTSGRVSAKNDAVARWSRRSSSVDGLTIRFSNPREEKCRYRAEPTRPRWPAMKIRVLGSSVNAGVASGLHSWR